MSKMATSIAASFFALLLSVSTLPAQTPQRPQEKTEWIADTLKEIQKIKIGMTRADLLKVFTTEGGLSSPFSRTYVYRECPYIKVDVEFEPVGRRDAEGRVTHETNEDVIKKISRPYLEWGIID